LLIWPVSRGIQRQFAVFDLMYYPWLGLFHDSTKLRDGQRVPRWWPDLPDQVMQKLDRLRALGYAPAAVSMYGVWTLRKYAEWVWTLDAQGNPAAHLLVSHLNRSKNCVISQWISRWRCSSAP